VTFDEEGEIKDDSQLLKKSAKGKTYERLEDKDGPSGIDINVAKDILRAEDAYDLQKERQRVRQLHKEKKRKEKEAKNKRKKESEEDNGEELPQLDQVCALAF
jgi:ATP-dependent RNA helicase DDX10/DBP4